MTKDQVIINSAQALSLEVGLTEPNPVLSAGWGWSRILITADAHVLPSLAFASFRFAFLAVRRPE
jgi:hypothetical protein